MTLKDLISSDVSLLLNSDDFAETVTRRPNGNTAGSEAQTANVFFPDAETQIAGGKSTTYDAQIQISSADSVTAADAYVIGSEVYSVVRIDKPVSGLRMVNLRRVEGDRTETRMSRNLK